MSSDPLHVPKSPASHWEILVTCLAVVAAALLLDVRSDDRVALAALPSHPLPQTCGCQAVLGIPCPCCGLTRSFVHLAHGRWMQSWHAHRLGWLLAGALLIQFPYRFAALRWREREILGERFRRWFVPALVGLLLANWFLVLGRLSGLFAAR
jgi:Protein of unknown function (DUF2752)